MKVGFYVQHLPGFDRRRDDNAAWWSQYGNVYADVNRDGQIHTTRAIFEDAERDDNDWTIIVQDDGRPFVGWREELDGALAHSPGHLLSLSHFATIGQKCAAAGYAYGAPYNCGPVWAHSRECVRGTVRLLPRIMEINPKYHHADGPPYIWTILAGHPPVFTARALFDHACWQSTLGHGEAKRRPLLTIFDSGPAWDTPGVWRARGTYESKECQAMLAALREEGWEA